MLKGLWKEVTQAYDRYKLHMQAVVGLISVVLLIRFVPDSWLQHQWLLKPITLKWFLGSILGLLVLNLLFFFQIRFLRAELALNDLPKETLEQKRVKRNKETLGILNVLFKGLFTSDKK